MTRTQLLEIRNSIDHLTSYQELEQLVVTLLDEIEIRRNLEYQLRADYAALLESARATVTAAILHHKDPTERLKMELSQRGLLPAAGVSPQQMLADTATLRAVLDPAS